MVPYLLDFHEYIRFSKSLSEYQEQPYPLEKTVNYCISCNISRIFIEKSGNILIFNIHEHYFGIFPRISQGIFSEDTGTIPGECSTNIPRTYIYGVGSERSCQCANSFQPISVSFSFSLSEGEDFETQSEVRLGIC